MEDIDEFSWIKNFFWLYIKQYLWTRLWFLTVKVLDIANSILNLSDDLLLNQFWLLIMDNSIRKVGLGEIIRDYNLDTRHSSIYKIPIISVMRAKIGEYRELLSKKR